MTSPAEHYVAAEELLTASEALDPTVGRLQGQERTEGVAEALENVRRAQDVLHARAHIHAALAGGHR